MARRPSPPPEMYGTANQQGLPMKTVWANAGHPLNGAIGDFVSLRIFGEPGAFRDHTALAVFEQREGGALMVAGLVYHDYDGRAGVIQISGAADTPRWLTRPVLKEMFSFPFDELGCQAVVMRVDPGDVRLARILSAYGFERHLLPRMRGRDRDDALFILFDDVWRGNGFHKGRH